MKAYNSGSPSKSSDLDITISVQDINDNSPQFDKPVFDMSFKELSAPLSIIGFVNATDKDSGNNGKLHYHIVEDQTAFGTLRLKPCDTSLRVYVSTVRLCISGIYPSVGSIYIERSFSDEEVREPFLLSVVATDNGVNPRNATCTVRISVTDENDNAPRLPDVVYEFSVPEDALPGREVSLQSVCAQRNLYNTVNPNILADKIS